LVSSFPNQTSSQKTSSLRSEEPVGSLKKNQNDMDSISMIVINTYLIISGAMAAAVVIALILKLLDRILTNTAQNTSKIRVFRQKISFTHHH